MEIREHIDALQAHGDAMAAAADAAGLDAPVPSCPDWVVRDLVRHTGGVHRWATGIVSGPRTEPWRVDLTEVVGSWPTDQDLLGWFSDGHSALVAALSSADPQLRCWAFLAAPSPLAMWARRQAHETAIHRADAELAAGQIPATCSAEFAADGVDELVSCFITRRGGELRADPARTLRLLCTDAAGDWLVRIGPDGVDTQSVQDGDGTEADCQMSGHASDLYLSLWNRRAGQPPLVDGDRAVAALFSDKVRVRW
jgi:uncharacterized protein (TIGR03083 family)